MSHQEQLVKQQQGERKHRNIIINFLKASNLQTPNDKTFLGPFTPPFQTFCTQLSWLICLKNDNRTVYQLLSKVISGLWFLCLVIGLKISCQFSNQWKTKLKTVLWASYSNCWVHCFVCSCYDWLEWLPSIGFSKVIWKPLQQIFTSLLNTINKIHN